MKKSPECFEQESLGYQTILMRGISFKLFLIHLLWFNKENLLNKLLHVVINCLIFMTSVFDLGLLLVTTWGWLNLEKYQSNQLQRLKTYYWIFLAILKHFQAEMQQQWRESWIWGDVWKWAHNLIFDMSTHFISYVRSPSPEPIYNTEGKRLNTREFRVRKKLEEERHVLIQEALSLNEDYKPPADYK